MQCCAAGHQAPYNFFWQEIYSTREGGRREKKTYCFALCVQACTRISAYTVPYSRAVPRVLLYGTVSD